MEKTISDLIEYSVSLIGLPYRWYVEEIEIFSGDDKFWCENKSPPSLSEMILKDKCIVYLSKKAGHKQNLLFNLALKF